MKGMLVLNQLFIILSRPVWERKCIGLTAVWFSSASSNYLNFDPVLLTEKKDHTCLTELAFWLFWWRAEEQQDIFVYS